MPVNVCQHRGFVGVFNSRFIHIKQPNIFKNAFSQSNVKQTIAKETFLVFASFSIFLLISITWSFVNLVQIRARFINFSVARLFYFCVLLTFVHHIWLYLIISIILKRGHWKKSWTKAWFLSKFFYLALEFKQHFGWLMVLCHLLITLNTILIQLR